MSNEITIVPDDLTDGNIVKLLEQHRAEMFKHSPPESVHALDVQALKSPELSFWSVNVNGVFAGCGALNALDETSAEIKSMKTDDRFLRRGVAKAVLAHISGVAKSRGLNMLYLETGRMDAFIPARRLYQAFGFKPCAPFADYVEDPHSICMNLALDSICSQA